MSGLHTWRAGDPGTWNSETIPAAFSSASPDVTTWVYDLPSGLLLQKKDAAGRGPLYAWSNAGLLQSRTWARGVVATYGHTAAAEVGSVTYSDGTPGMTRSYCRDGSLDTVTDAAGTTTYAYTGANPGGESVVGGLLDGLSLEYPQANGRRQSFTAELGETGSGNQFQI